MRYLSTFSGIGGFELGIQLAYEKLCIKNKVQGLQGVGDTEGLSSQFDNVCKHGLTCIGYSEIDKYASAIYQKHFPEHKKYGDITKIVAEDLPDFDLLVGGFPCQAFSIAGKRGGFEDTRGTMFFELARILRAKQPRLFVFENVKGLLSHDGGKSFSTIIQTLDELGYDCQWQVLNSKNHGVPQNRERVFIIGHLRGTPRPQVFPFGETDGTTDTGFEPRDTEVSSTLRSRYGNGTGRHIQQLNNPTHSNDRVYGTGGVIPTLNTMQGGMRQPFVVDPQGRKNKVCTPTSSSPTLRANTHGNQPVVNGIRRLTPTECERLQGFPDGWTEGISDTQRYKTLGNAITTFVIRDIFIKLL
jgi:DNA (cytosine-5)-methyltransferase 1